MTLIMLQTMWGVQKNYPKGKGENICAHPYWNDDFHSWNAQPLNNLKSIPFTRYAINHESTPQKQETKNLKNQNIVCQVETDLISSNRAPEHRPYKDS